jgi:hypothetical protein
VDRARKKVIVHHDKLDILPPCYLIRLFFIILFYKKCGWERKRGVCVCKNILLYSPLSPNCPGIILPDYLILCVLKVHIVNKETNIRSIQLATGESFSNGGKVCAEENNILIFKHPQPLKKKKK